MSDLSILLPTYNGARYLEEQVRSIMAQGFRDWRLLVCDDGSTDATVAVAAGLAREDDRIAVLPSTGNAGQRRRLREMVAVADAALIAIADQDDIWVPDKLALLLEALGDADLCFGSSWLIDGEGRPLGRQLGDSIPPPYRAGDRLTWLFRPLVSAHALVARRALFGDVLFARAVPFDWLMTVEAAFGGGLRYVPEARTLHRMHGANQSNGIFAARPKAPRLVGRSALLGLPREVERGRMHFMAMLEHLHHAPSLPEDVRRRAAGAYKACHQVWYRGWRTEYDPSRTLPEKIEAILRPLAGSDADWRYFGLRFDAIALPLYAPSRVLARRRRLAIEWPSRIL